MHELIHRTTIVQRVPRLVEHFRRDPVCPAILLKVKRVHLHGTQVANGGRSYAFQLDTKKRARQDVIIVGALHKELDSCDSFFALLDLIEEQHRFARHQRGVCECRQAQKQFRGAFCRLNGSTSLRVLEKVNLDHVGPMPRSELTHKKRLAHLASPRDEERLLRPRAVPLLKSVHGFSFQHIGSNSILKLVFVNLLTEL